MDYLDINAVLYSLKAIPHGKIDNLCNPYPVLYHCTDYSCIDVALPGLSGKLSQIASELLTIFKFPTMSAKSRRVSLLYESWAFNPLSRKLKFPLTGCSDI